MCQISLRLIATKFLSKPTIAFKLHWHLMKRLIHHGKRVIRITGGIVIVLVGLILAIPGVPGPGLLVIFIGLSILAMDFVWAHRLKTKIEHQAGKVIKKVRGQPEAETTAPAEKT